MSTLFVNRLTVIDFAYLDPEIGLVGESWQVDIELEGRLDQQGMVLDFGLVKKQVKQTVDHYFDHRLLIPANYSGTELTSADGLSTVTFRLKGGTVITHLSPADALAPIEAEEINPEVVTRAIVDSLKPILPDNVDTIRLRLHTESHDNSWYRYTHGLKLHDGNCQRIAHGHRSRIEIFQNGKRSTQLEQHWAERWRDIYIGNRDDLIDEHEESGNRYYRFGYQAPQGRFELSLPSDRCYLIDTDSTVENLAQHIADRLKSGHPDSDFQILAYEGVDKGAMGVA
ncbi:MAG: hypothetical protein GY934_16865 [Gammaproteobacteria bacterium]|nr:hypothetical protein [Gammaproteobacteria bacterium]